MELLDVLRTTGAVREFTGEAVPDDVVYRVLDTARFAPSGGNQQGWHVVVVRDPDKKRALRDLYLPGWYDYLGISMIGLRPWAPTNDRAAEAKATPAPPGDGFAEHLHEVPVLLALFVDLGVVAAVDRDFDRYSFAGGASVYPFAWSVLLAARAEGLGGVITTMCIRSEPEVKALLGAPDQYALAAVIALGHPVKQPTRLRRAAVEDFTTVDRFDGRALQSPPVEP
jgi:nitroreductase